MFPAVWASVLEDIGTLTTWFTNIARNGYNKLKTFPACAGALSSGYMRFMRYGCPCKKLAIEPSKALNDTCIALSMRRREAPPNNADL
mmetsp:Transcript_37977/g.60980  ORF Transcript_37977/g.60980 Transcript_37977/m.60980 type:complete len:88 (-) Transcript_37977:840-1103(-)